MPVGIFTSFQNTHAFVCVCVFFFNFDAESLVLPPHPPPCNPQRRHAVPGDIPVIRVYRLFFSVRLCTYIFALLLLN